MITPSLRWWLDTRQAGMPCAGNCLAIRQAIHGEMAYRENVMRFFPFRPASPLREHGLPAQEIQTLNSGHD
jgi:hypothetical protein